MTSGESGGKSCENGGKSGNTGGKSGKTRDKSRDFGVEKWALLFGKSGVHYLGPCSLITKFSNKFF